MKIKLEIFYLPTNVTTLIKFTLFIQSYHLQIKNSVSYEYDLIRLQGIFKKSS